MRTPEVKQSSLQALLLVAWQRAGSRLLVLIFVALLASVVEMFGIGMILPLFSIASNGVVGDDKFSQFIVQLLDSAGLEATLQIMLLIMVVAFTTKAIFLLASTIIELWITTKIRRDIQLTLAQLIESARFTYHHTEKAGTNTNLLSRECERFTSTIRNLARGIVAAISSLVFVVTMGVLNPGLTTMIILLCLVVIFLLRPVIRWTRQYSVNTTDYYASAQSSLLELVQNIAYLKATQGTTRLQKNIETRINQLTHVQRRIGLISSGLNAIKEPIGIIVLAGIIFYDVVLNGNAIAEVIVVGLVFYKIVHRLLDIQNNWQRMNTSIGGVFAVEDGIKRLLAAQEELTGEQEADFSLPLVFQNVSAKYGDVCVLNDLNITIQPHETIGLVGPSGAGKSTFFHLITGLLKPSSGSIKLGLVNYSNIDKTSLRSQVGYVTQDPAMFHATLAENIAFWRCDPADKLCWQAIESAAEDAGCSDLLERAHELVGEQGKQFSGGQRQRIAIARELFKTPPLLIFDEATSALDSQSESAIQESIHALHGQRTILIIAHRLSSVKGCDRIIVLDAGKIVQQGKFDELWHDKDSLFRSLCDSQGISTVSL